MVAVRDDERERRAERDAVTQAGEHLDLVLLELLPRASAVALPAAAEVVVDRSRSSLRPAGSPTRTATSAGPWDSPAVTSSSVKEQA